MKIQFRKIIVLACVLSLLCSAVPVQAATAKKIVLDQKVFTIMVGMSEQIIASTSPIRKNVKLKWESSDKTIAEISETGLVKGINPGKATITVSAKGYKKVKCKVFVVEKKVSETQTVTDNSNDTGTSTNKIVMNSELVMNTNRAKKIEVTTTPSNSNVELNWQSSDIDVVRVLENGYIFARKVGEATITVSANGYKEATCKVTVVNNVLSVGDIVDIYDPNSDEKVLAQDSSGTDFADYDNTTINGILVKRVLENFKEQPYIIAVTTKKFEECTKDYYQGSVPFDKVNAFFHGCNQYYVSLLSINYNAVMGERYLGLGDKCFKNANGENINSIVYRGKMKTENGVQVYNNNYKDAYDKDSTAYIDDNSYYKSMLIRDINGKIIGIYIFEI